MSQLMGFSVVHTEWKDGTKYEFGFGRYDTGLHGAIPRKRQGVRITGADGAVRWDLSYEGELVLAHDYYRRVSICFSGLGLCWEEWTFELGVGLSTRYFTPDGKEPEWGIQDWPENVQADAEERRLAAITAARRATRVERLIDTLCGGFSMEEGRAAHAVATGTAAREEGPDRVHMAVNTMNPATWM